ncbi:MAG: DUF92 domain-containing protein [Ignavibacteria bacterium]|nr:DUF92 domain-containing protein [Ignavibacteria bacterium]
MTEQALLGVFYAAIISIISFAVRFLTLGGAVSQFVLGSIVLGLGGWQWTVPMLAFFLFSSLLSILGKPNKIRAASVYEKSYCRDGSQVFANGGVGGLIALLWYLLQDDFWFIAYLGSIGAAAADTWETEIAFVSFFPAACYNFPASRTWKGQVRSRNLGLLAGCWVQWAFGLARCPGFLILLLQVRRLPH